MKQILCIFFNISILLFSFVNSSLAQNDLANYEIKNLYSTSHVPYQISTKNQIIMKWQDVGDDIEITGFYYLFNTSKNHIFTEENTYDQNVHYIKKGSMLEAISPVFSNSDDVSYFFHIAPANENIEIIGKTTSYGPIRIDDVPPQPVSVSSDNYSSERVINLFLGALNAYEMNISSRSYGKGEWERFQNSKTWLLNDNQGLQNIYVQFRDMAGNTSNAKTSIIYDSIKPDVLIESQTGSLYTNVSPISISITFNEPIQYFNKDDIIIENSSIKNLIGIESENGFYSKFKADIITENQGQITIKIPDGACNDLALNNNISSDEFIIYYDSINPIIEIISSAKDYVNYSQINMEIKFSEEVSGFESDDISVNGAAISNFLPDGTGPFYSSYNFDLIPDDQGEVSLTIPKDSAFDRSGNMSIESSTFITNYDSIRPGVSISKSITDTAYSSPIPLTIIFTEPVDGFELSDINILNATADEFKAQGQGPSYTLFNLDINPTDNSVVYINIDQGKAVDIAGNTNTSLSEPLLLTYESLNPAVNISSSSPYITSVSPIPITVQFNKPVSGFDVSDIVISGGNIQNFTEHGISGSYTAIYSFDVVCEIQNTVSIEIPENIAKDEFNNQNSRSAKFIRIFDINDPPIISSISDQNTKEDELISPVNFTISDADGGLLSITVNSSNTSLISEEAGFITICGNDVCHYGNNFTFSADAGQDNTFIMAIMPANEQSGSASITVSVSDGQNLKTSSFNIIVEEINDSPVIVLSDEVVVYTENSAPVILDNNAYVTDKDSEIFNDAILKIELSKTDPLDRLLILHQGFGLDEIGVNTSNEILYENKKIGNFSGGLADEPLIITFTGENRDIDIDLITKIIRRISYENTSESLIDDSITAIFSLIEKNQQYLSFQKTILIKSLNMSPVISISDEPSLYIENASPIQIVPEAALVDQDSLNFASGILQVNIISTSSDDRIGIINNEQITILNNQISYNDNIIGNFISDAKVLTITFNTSSNQESAQALLRNISFETISDVPSTENRIANFTMTDGDGGQSIFEKTINVISSNDAPVNHIPYDFNIDEDTFHIFSGSTAIFVNDADALNNFIRLSISAENGLLSLANPEGVNLMNGDGKDDMLIEITGSVNTINTAINNLIYTPFANFSGTEHIEIYCNDHGYSGSDDEIKSDTDVINLSVNPINDRPIISKISSQVTKEDTSISVPLLITDVDQDELIITASSSINKLVGSTGLAFIGDNIVFENNVYKLIPVSNYSEITLSILPQINQFGKTNITVSIIDPHGESDYSAFELIVESVNDAPTASQITHQYINEDTTSAPIYFTVFDPETDAVNISLNAVSSNTSIIKNENIRFFGISENRYLKIFTSPNQTGTVTITVMSTDPELNTGFMNFLVTINPVNDTPKISQIPDNETFEDLSISIPFILTDVDGDIVEISFEPDNPEIVNKNDILLIGDHVEKNGLQYFVDTAYANSVRLTAIVNPISDKNGDLKILIQAVDESNKKAWSDVFLSVKALPDFPSISAIDNITTEEDTIAGPFALTVLDPDMDIYDLSIKGFTDNTTLIDSESIIIDGIGTNRMLTIRPSQEQFGNALITLIVEDSTGLTASTSFELTVTQVNDAPKISDIPDQTTSLNIPLKPVYFTITDVETNSSDLLVSANSSYSPIVIDILGDSENRALSITTPEAYIGLSTITIKVKDTDVTEPKTTIFEFYLNITDFNDPPEISEISDQIINEDTISEPITFIINDKQTKASNLGLTVQSSDIAILPVEKINLGGTGSVRTITLKPEDSQTGNVTVTVSVIDSLNLKASTSFKLTINPQNDAPDLYLPLNIYAGEKFNLALSFSGELKSWGLNESGEAGIPASIDYTASHEINNIFSSGQVKSVAAGENHSLVLKTDSTVWGFGLNDYGQLGSAPEKCFTPVEILKISNISKLAAGKHHSMALKQDGTILAWGNNANGQLGDMTTIDTQTPVQVKGKDGIGVISGIIDIDAGDFHTAALDKDGLVWTWGANSHGQLGNNTDIDSLYPQIVKVKSGAYLSDIVAIAAREYRTMALKADGSIWAWGANLFGQLGNGESGEDANKLYAVKIDSISNVRAIAAGKDHSVALKRDGTVWTWGANTWGQLGDGTNLKNSLPKKISGFESEIIGISAGGDHTFAMDKNGAIWSWGRNDSGQLGDGSFLNKNMPVKVIFNDKNLNMLEMKEDIATIPIQIKLSDMEDLSENLSIFAQSSNTAVIQNSKIIIQKSPYSSYMTIVPELNKSGISEITLSLSDSQGLTSKADFYVNVEPVNDLPVMSLILDQKTDENTTIESIPYTIFDVESPLNEISFSAKWSYTKFEPDDNIVFSGSDVQRYLSITPPLNEYGSFVITIIAKDSDGGEQERSFNLSVNDRPDISQINDIYIDEDSWSNEISFKVFDAESEGCDLVVMVRSKNQDIIKDSDLSYFCDNNEYYLTAKPLKDMNGSVEIEIQVFDESAYNSSIFNIIVQPKNDPPVITLPDEPVKYTENDTIIVNLEASVDDIDSSNFNKGVLSVKVISDPTDKDRFMINNQGLNEGQIGLTKQNIFYSGSYIGRYEQISLENENRLVITFDNESSNKSAVEALLKNIIYYNTSDNPEPLTRIIQFDFSDGDGDEASGEPALRTVQIIPVNDAPTIRYNAYPVSGEKILDPIFEEGFYIFSSDYLSRISINDIDAGSEMLMVTITANQGIISLNADYSFNLHSLKGDSTRFVRFESSVDEINAAMDSMTYVGSMNQTGNETIRIEVSDKGNSGYGGYKTAQVDLTFDVINTNDPPSIDFIPDQKTSDATPLAVQINVKDVDFDDLFIWGTSENNSIVKDEAISFSGDAAAGSDSGIYTVIMSESGSIDLTLNINPYEHEIGNSTINIFVKDKEGLTYQRSFDLEVELINDPPTIDHIEKQYVLSEKSEPKTLTLTGITDGDGGHHFVSLFAVSSNKNLIPDPVITYNYPETTAIMTYTPVLFASGTTTITITVIDDGGTANNGKNINQISFDVRVTLLNIAPTIDNVSNPDPIYEDAILQTIVLEGISDGNDGKQEISIKAVSSAPSIIPNPVVLYTSPASVGILSYKPSANAHGSATITIIVQDDAGVANGGHDTTEINFDVIVLPVNDKPTIDPVADFSYLSLKAGVQRVTLTGISDGDNNIQDLNIEVKSSDTSLIPTPAIFYESPYTTATLAFSPVGDKPGNVEITITLKDNGGTQNGGIDTNIIKFNVPLVWINTAPTIIQIPEPPAILEDSGKHTIMFSGISDGDQGTQNIRIEVESSNTDLIPTPVLSYTQNDSIAKISYNPSPGKSGSSNITVSVIDDGGILYNGKDTTKINFTINVLPVNDSPTINSIFNPPPVLSNSGPVNITLTGISDGDDGSQYISIFAESSNPQLIPPPEVIYLWPSSTARLIYIPQQQKTGSAIITVTVKDTGGTLNNGIDKAEINFVVKVTEVDVAPVAYDGHVYTDEETPVSFKLESFDNNDDELIHIIIDQCTKGSLELVDTMSGTINYTPYEDENGTDSFTFNVYDGEYYSESATVYIHITPVNDNPVIELNSTGFDYTENQGAIKLVPDAYVNDVDTPYFTNGELSIDFRFNGTSSDRIFFNNNTAEKIEILENKILYNSINAGSFNGGNNGSTPLIITFNESTDVMAIGAVLRSLYYENNSKNPYTSLKTLRFILSDGEGGRSNDKTIAIKMISINDDPKILFNSLEVIDIVNVENILEDSSKIFSSENESLITIIDPDGESGDFTVKLSSIRGMLSLNPSALNKLVFTEGSGTDEFSMEFTGSLHDINDALSGITYKASKDEVGIENIIIIAKDNGNSGIGGGDDISRIIKFNIQPVNDAPEISEINDQITYEGASLNLIFTIKDKDNDDVKIYATSSNPFLVPADNIIFEGDSISQTDGHNYTIESAFDAKEIMLKAQPVAGLNGKTIITIYAGDGIINSHKEFQLTVSPVNDPPVVSDILNQTFTEGASFKTIILKDYVEDDEDAPEVVTWSAVGQKELICEISNGLAKISVPDENWFGSETISFVAKDSGGLTAQDQAVFTLTPINDAPEISSISNLSLFWGIELPVIKFSVKDVDDNSIFINAKSSNAAVIPDLSSNLYIMESGETYYTLTTSQGQWTDISLTIIPLEKSYGSSDISIIVSDSKNLTGSTLFNYEYKPVIIQADTGNNGVINPGGDVYLSYGESFKQFEIVPDYGFKVKDVIVDDVSQGVLKRYTFWNIIENHTINVLFQEADEYTINAAANPGGTIQPSGAIKVYEEDSLSFIINPETGYEIKYIEIDGVLIPETNLYTFDNIIKDHDIVVTFQKVPPPVAQIIADPDSGLAPLAVKFFDDSLNKISSWQWDFGDGHKSVLQNPQHTYSKQGTYTVTLLVKGPGGEDSVSTTIQVENIPINICFSADHITGTPPLEVSFTSELSDNVIDVIWNFGDGNVSTDLNPIHSYTKTGNYTVSLTAYSDQGHKTLEKVDFIKIYGRSIQGRITGEDNLQVGIAGFIVEAWLNETTLGGQAISDGNGYYKIEGLIASENIILSVWPNSGSIDYYNQYYNGKDIRENADLLSTKDGDLENINFILKKSTGIGLTGKIHDGYGNSNGIFYNVSVFSETALFGAAAITDEYGYYTITGLKPADDYRIYVWSSEFKKDYYYAIPNGEQTGSYIPNYSVLSWEQATKVSPALPVIKNIDIIISKGGSIKGNVIANGLSVSNIWVNAWSDLNNIGNGALTDENGNYTITGLAALSNGKPITYIVEIPSVNYPYQVYNLQSDKQYATPVLVESDNINFILKTELSISGRLLDENNLPLSGINIRAWSKTKNINQESTTDENGVYTIYGLLPESDYIVAAFPLFYPVQYYNEKTSIDQADMIDLRNGDVSGINFKLSQGAIIQGIIYKENNQTTVSSGVWVNIWSESTDTGGDVPTDSQGRYKITGLLSDVNDYKISVRYTGYLPAFYNSELENTTSYRWDLAEGIAPSKQDRNLLLIKGYDIKGKITFNNQPIANIKVEAWSEETGSFASTTSQAVFDKNGYNYVLSGLADGNYNINIKSSNYEDESRTVSIEDNTYDIDFSLNQPERAISGLIIGLQQNHEIWINAWSDSISFAKTIKLVGSGSTLVYSINGLKKASDYKVELRSFNYLYTVYDNKHDVNEASFINLLESDAVNIDFAVELSGQETISGDVTFPIGALKGDKVWIDAFSYSTGSGKSSQIILSQDAIGEPVNQRYLLIGLEEADDFIVSIWSDKYKTQYYDHETDRIKASMVNTSDDIPDDSIDFSLTAGAYISGTIVDEFGNGLSKITVEAWSKNTNTYVGTQSNNNGYFEIIGLEYAKDYIIEARKGFYDSFYYNSTGTVRKITLAEPVSTIETNPENIVIEIIEGECIKGTIFDKQGQPLSNIWITAWSESQQAGGAYYSDSQGNYIICGLPSSEDYKLSVTPHWSLPYSPQEKINIKTSQTDVDFYLSTGWTISGKVSNNDAQALKGILIEVWSDEKDIYGWSRTDASGQYKISGLPTAYDYVIVATPLDNESYISFSEQGSVIYRDLIKDITLLQAFIIDGYLYIKDSFSNNIPYTTSVLVTAYSQEADYFGSAMSNSSGYYKITNLPDAQDYIVTVRPDDYSQAEKDSQSSSSTVNFVLEPGGTISGNVKDATGIVLKGVYVRVFSESLNFSKSVVTDSNGNYNISGLKSFNNSNPVSDYIVNVKASGYPEQSKGMISVNQIVNFTLLRGTNNVISGTIKDISLNPPPSGISIIIKIFEKTQDNIGGFIDKIMPDKDGNFIFKGLNPDKTYQLLFKATGTTSGTIQQWAENDNGVGRDASTEYNTGQIIEFKFNNNW